MNPLCLVACALLAPAPTAPDAANGVLIPLERETYVRQVPFTSYRLGAYALGYEFRKADMTYVGDAQAPGGRRAVLRLHFTNPTARNSFDIIQTTRSGALTTEQSVRQVLKLKTFEIPNDGTMTMVYRRANNVEIGFVGSIISGPSAQRVLDAMTPAPRN